MHFKTTQKTNSKQTFKPFLYFHFLEAKKLTAILIK